jgi:hypothetical protein
MENDRKELNSMPSVDLRHLIDHVKSSDASNQLRDSVMKAGLVDPSLSADWLKNPWEKSKSYKIFKELSLNSTLKIPKEGQSISLYAPSRHRLFVKYCKTCIGVMSFVSEWNKDVEVAFYRRIEGRTNDELRATINKLNEFILEQSSECESLRKELSSMKKGSKWFETWKQVSGIDEDLNSKYRYFR